MAQVLIVPVDNVVQTWPLVEKFLRSSVELGNDGQGQCYNLHHVQAFVASGAWVLYVAVDEGQVIGAATVSFINYPLQRVAFITQIGGRMIASKEMFEQFKAALKARGATKLQGYGRPSIVRLWRKLDIEPSMALIEATL